MRSLDLIVRISGVDDIRRFRLDRSASAEIRLSDRVLGVPLSPDEDGAVFWARGGNNYSILSVGAPHRALYGFELPPLVRNYADPYYIWDGVLFRVYLKGEVRVLG